MDALVKLGIGGAHPGGLALTKELIQKETINSDTHILDIGCGTGLTSFYLYNNFKCQVTPCDLHSLMIEKANERFSKSGLPICALLGNSEALDSSDQSFDYVISESVTAFTDINKSLNEYYRVLKPGGKLLGVEMAHDGTLPKDELMKIKNFYRLQKLLTLNNWREEIEKSQFSNVKISTYKIDYHNTDSTYDMLPSPSIDSKVYDTLYEHQRIIETYESAIFPCIIYGEKW